MISVTITDRSGRTLSGQTIDAFYVSIAHAQPFSVGINCALGARDMRPYLAELARIADCYVSCYPNAGLPNAFGEYDELPDETGALLARLRRRAASSTSSAAAAARRRSTSRRSPTAVDGLPPRPALGRTRRDRRARDAATHFTQFSGLETADDPPRQQLPDDRRADQRHRLEAVRAADQGRQLRRGGAASRSSRCAAAPTSSTSTWTRACSTPSRR